MQKNYPDKAISNKDIAPEQDEKLIEFNFPERGVTVKARDLDEAKEKLKKLISQ